MLRVLLVCASVCCAGVSGVADEHPQPGQQPTDPGQRARVTAARRSLAAAMSKGDLDAIVAAEADVRSALGPFAGVPEAPEPRNPPGTKARRPSADDFRELVARMGSLGSGSADARANRMELRNPAYLAIGLLALAEAGLPDAAAYRAQAARELDYLISKQADAGFFPYPADPVAAPHLRALAAKISREHPERVRDGFIVLDVDGSQFDTGCAAYALAYGFQLLEEERFLTAARKAGDWAVEFPVSPNWNYNAFSVWQLAKLADVTGEQRYLDAAVRIARLGVLPGLMDSGRWSDQHNAKAVYHWIMVRGLVELLRVLPQDDVNAAVIRGRTRLAVQAGVDDVLAHGGSNSVQPFVSLAGAIDLFGAEPTWEQALSELGGINPYSAGVFARRQRAVQ